MRAGSDGATPPGGGAHMSFGLVAGGVLLVAANRAAENIRTAKELRRMCLVQFVAAVFSAHQNRPIKKTTLSDQGWPPVSGLTIPHRFGLDHSTCFIQLDRHT